MVGMRERGSWLLNVIFNDIGILNSGLLGTLVQ